LAELKLFELESATNSSMPHFISAQMVCSNAVCHPTALTAETLNQVSKLARSVEDRRTAGKWVQTWEENESSRVLFSAVSEQLLAQRQRDLLLSATISSEDQNSTTNFDSRPMPSVSQLTQPSTYPFWFKPPLGWTRIEATNSETASRNVRPAIISEPEARDLLALPVVDDRSNRWFVCRSEIEILADVARLVTDARRIPEYLGVALDLAEKRVGARERGWAVFDLRKWGEVDYFGRNGGGQKKEYSNELASDVLASAVKTENGVEQLKVSIYLTSPSALFKSQRARTFWFGLLIAASAGAAFIGLITAHQAFRRQLLLAEMKTNFVSSVSHELRAPIASVRLLAESLERGRIAEAPKQQEYFRFIVQECRRLSSLIENVLDFSRIEQGRKQYEIEPTDVLALVLQTVKLMEPYAAERQVAVAFDRPQGLTSDSQFQADGKALQQALINLIDNALKHSPKGATVTVGLEEEETGVRRRESGDGRSERGSSLKLWVEDRGEGIAPDEHEKIFERFYRCGRELRRETQGVGIGLSIVKHIVEAHGGRVLVRSDIGQGSRFTIELPLLARRDKSEFRVPKSE
jgi:signal transduction histidine kinase